MAAFYFSFLRIPQTQSHWVFPPKFSPYSPEIIKEALLQLGQQQGDGRLGIHGDDPLARTQGSVTHKLVLISESLRTEAGSPRAAGPKAPDPKEMGSPKQQDEDSCHPVPAGREPCLQRQHVHPPLHSLMLPSTWSLVLTLRTQGMMGPT